MQRLYFRSPHTGNKYEVRDEETEELIATFYNQEAAAEYVHLKDTLRKCGIFSWSELTDEAKKTFSGIQDRINKHNL